MGANPHLLGAAGRGLRLQDQETGQTVVSGLQHLGPAARVLPGRIAPEPPFGARPLPGRGRYLQHLARPAMAWFWCTDRICRQDAPF